MSKMSKTESFSELRTKELVEQYSDEGENIGVVEKSESHDQMKKEFKEKGVVSTRHKHVLLMILTSQGRVILQRRSRWKGDNAGLWDKTIGGHVAKDDSYDLTILKECAEELGIPATVVSRDNFEHTVSVIDLNVLGILTKASFLDNHKSSRKKPDGTKWVHPSMTQFYIGYYDGAIRFIDKESCGIQVFSKKEIMEEIKNTPELFTDDILYMLNKFESLIKPVGQKRVHVLND